jgi:hypothetical protein
MREIEKKPTLIRNAIANQVKTAANSLRIQDWNEVVNILKQQANYNTAYLETLHRLLFFNFDSDTNGFIELLGDIDVGVLPYILEQLSIVLTYIENAKKGNLSYGMAYNQNIRAGDPVMFVGYVDTYFKLQVATPEVINAHPEYFVGIATEDIADGAYGYATELGIVLKADVPATTYNLGDVLWYDSTSGGYTTTKPLRNTSQIRIGEVIATNENGLVYTGSLFVRVTILDESSETNVVVSVDEPDVKFNNDIWLDI